MSEKNLPEHVDPFRFAEQQLSLTGTIQINELSRLSAYLSAKQGEVALELKFGIDEQGINFLKGHLQTTLNLECQRCLEPFSYEIISDFALGIVKTLEEANALPGHYEPAMAQENNLEIRGIVEDEIILSLPIIPRHAHENCKVKLPVEDTFEEEQKMNPFQVLASLKEKQK